MQNQLAPSRMHRHQLMTLSTSTSPMFCAKNLAMNILIKRQARRKSLAKVQLALRKSCQTLARSPPRWLVCLGMRKNFTKTQNTTGLLVVHITNQCSKNMAIQFWLPLHTMQVQDVWTKHWQQQKKVAKTFLRICQLKHATTSEQSMATTLHP